MLAFWLGYSLPDFAAAVGALGGLGIAFLRLVSGAAGLGTRISLIEGISAAAAVRAFFLRVCLAGLVVLLSAIWWLGRRLDSCYSGRAAKLRYRIMLAASHLIIESSLSRYPSGGTLDNNSGICVLY